MGGSACGGSETGLLRTISGLPRETAFAESKRGKKEGGDYLYLLKIQIFFSAHTSQCKQNRERNYNIKIGKEAIKYIVWSLHDYILRKSVENMIANNKRM